MGEPTNTKVLGKTLTDALRLVARDALASASAAGAIPGPQGLALSVSLAAMAQGDVRDLQSLSARVATLGGSPKLEVEALTVPKEWKASVEWLLEMQRESLEALAKAIPADADDAEGEATEHLLEHMIARKRDAMELLERALR